MIVYIFVSDNYNVYNKNKYILIQCFGNIFDRYTNIVICRSINRYIITIKKILTKRLSYMYI